jgi:hypothetical protein
MGGCNNNTLIGPGNDAVFRVQACSNQAFSVRMTDPETIRQAQQLLGSSDQPILNGTLLRGNGGFNGPHDWHLDATSIEFADVAAEVCDGCPDDIDRDVDYWVDTVGRFCPWTSRIIVRLR